MRLARGIGLVVVLVGGAFAGPASPQSPVDLEAMKAAQAAAKPALLALKLDDSFAKRLGFDNPKQAQQVTLGQPLPDYFVPLDLLQRYAPGADANGLLVRTSEVFIPLAAGTVTRSSMTMVQRNGSWVVGTLGAPKLAALIEKIRASVARSGPIRPSSFFIVRVPALGIVFLGHRIGTRILLTRVRLDPAVAGAPPEVPQPASTVFELLVPIAKQTKSDVPG